MDIKLFTRYHRKGIAYYLGLTQRIDLCFEQ